METGDEDHIIMGCQVREHINCGNCGTLEQSSLTRSLRRGEKIAKGPEVEDEEVLEKKRKTTK